MDVCQNYALKKNKLHLQINWRGREGVARPLSQEVLQNELIALPSKDASYPLTRHCYPHTAKINASVACALTATYGYSSHVSH